jgi:hypothetical protein
VVLVKFQSVCGLEGHRSVGNVSSFEDPREFFVREERIGNKPSQPWQEEAPKPIFGVDSGTFVDYSVHEASPSSHYQRTGLQSHEDSEEAHQLWVEVIGARVSS